MRRPTEDIGKKGSRTGGKQRRKTFAEKRALMKGVYNEQQRNKAKQALFPWKKARKKGYKEKEKTGKKKRNGVDQEGGPNQVKKTSRKRN